MDVLSILQYGGVALLVILLIVFEVRFRGTSGGNVAFGSADAYEYYAPNGSQLRIRRSGMMYRVYVVMGGAPRSVELMQDRYGNYFTLRARNNQQAEQMIDDLYR